LIDPALLRPGRFDYQLEVPLPDETGLLEIYKIHLRSKPLTDDIDYSALGSQSKQFSGAHVAEVCRRAALAAFRENDFIPAKTKIEMRHIIEAIKIVRKTIGDIDKPKFGFV
jgi:transitional endoplasmic reticulum ATPase